LVKTAEGITTFNIGYSILVLISIYPLRFSNSFLTRPAFTSKEILE
jgi:hypothetical protein